MSRGSKPHQTPLAQAASKAIGLGAVRAEQQLVIQQSQYTGEIPHPDILKQFDQLIPGTGAKLIRWAEEEQQHRRSMERAAMDANIAAQHSQSLTNAYTARAIFRSDMMGQTCGVLVCLVCVVGAIWMGTIGQPWVAAALAAIPTAAVVQAFRSSMFGRKRQAGEGKSKS